MINIKTFDPNLLKIDNKSYKDIGIDNIGYITIKKIDDYENFCCVNPFYMIVNHVSGYIEEKGVNEYLIIVCTDENKELLKKYNNFWSGIRDKIKKVSSGGYEKNYMKSKFNSDHDLPLNKPLKFHNMPLTIKSIFKENGKTLSTSFFR